MKKGFLIVIIGLAGVLSSSCNFTDSRTEDNSKKVEYYFSLQDYFKNEANRLSQLNPSIEKTVLLNDKQEVKTLKIEDWDNELQSFINSDINKDAWKNSYSVDTIENSIVYLALEGALKTRNIKISRNESKEIVGIEVINHVDNELYVSQETLIYVPNKSYTIKMNQNVLILGENNFFIDGKIK